MMRSAKAPYILLLALSAAFFWEFTLLGRIPVDSTPLSVMRPWSRETPSEVDSVSRYHNIDPIVEVFPIKKWMAEQLRKGEIPYWTSSIFSGAPFAANHHAAPWDFSTPLFLLLPVDFAFGLTLLLHLFIAGATTFFFCRTLQFPVGSSLLAATAFQFNSFFFHWLGLISFNAGLIWIPLIPAGIELSFRNNSLRYCAISGAGLGLVFLSGMGQFWLFGAFLFFAYGTYRWVTCGATAKRFSAWALAGLLGAGLGAVQLAATLSALPSTSRGGAQAGVYEGRNHLSPRRLPTLLIPNLYGHHEENVFSKLILNSGYPEANGWTGRLVWGEKGSVFNRAWGYIGIPAFLLMLVGFKTAKQPVRFFRWLALGVVSFQVLLCWEPFHQLCARLWKGFDTLDHTRTIVLYAFAASILAAEGLERLHEWKGKALERLIGAAALGFAALIMALLAIPEWTDIPAAVQGIATQNDTVTTAFFADAGPKIAQGFRDSAKILMVPLVVLSLLFFVLYLLRRSKLTWPAAQAAIILLSIGDLAYHGWSDPPLEFALREQLYPPASGVIEYLKRDTETFRVYELHKKRPLPAVPTSNYSDLQTIRRSTIRFFDLNSVEFVLRPNTLMAYGIESAGGYMSLYPGRYKELWAGRGMDILKAWKPGQVADQWKAPWIGMQNIKYILMPEEIPTGAWIPEFQSTGIQVMKVDSYLPRIYAVPKMRVVDDPAAMISEIRNPLFRPDREVLLEENPPEAFSSDTIQLKTANLVRSTDSISFSAEISAHGYLVIAENHFPGWHAFVNGKETRILAANHTFQCLPLRAGKHEIRLEFRPPYYTISLLISIASAVLILLAAMYRKPHARESDHRGAPVL